jgi:hypothetical protein
VLIIYDILEYFCPPQTHNPQTRKQRPDRSIETSTERLPKRARLTEKNLKAFEMGGRQRKSAGKKSAEQLSSITTTTDKDFGPQLQRNNVIFNNIDVRPPDDINEVRDLFNQRRESEPPDQLAYKRYLVTTQGYKNEATIQYSAYPLLAKRTSAEREISGYTQSANYTWSEIDNHLTTGLSNAKPDTFESYRKTDYPPQVVDTLSSALAPTSYDIAMPAFAVEYKGYDGSMAEAQLQCAYDGTLMTEGARAVHTYMDNSDDDFYGKTQAVTIAYNGDTVKFYGHHAVRIPVSSQPAVVATVDSSVDTTSDPLEYHQYVLTSDAPRDSFENFLSAYKHIRNAQDIGYKWATKRKDALWAYTNRDNTQIPPDVATSAQQPLNDALVLISSGTPDGYNCDAYDDGVVPTGQLLGEYSASFVANNQDSEQIPTADNGYRSPDALAYPPITPPQSSKDNSLPRESQQLSTVMEAREDVDERSHKRARRTRTRATDPVTGSKEVDHAKLRKSTRKRQG